jgi:hypothetical protein
MALCEIQPEHGATADTARRATCTKPMVPTPRWANTRRAPELPALRVGIDDLGHLCLSTDVETKRCQAAPFAAAGEICPRAARANFIP